MNSNERIADLTVEQLRDIIRKTVQEAMAEVLLEFSLAAEYDAQVVYQAEMTDLLRASLHDQLLGSAFTLDNKPALDD